MSGAPIAPAVRVALRDANGDATTGTATITIALASNPAGGTLSGTLSVAAVNGIATFDDLSIDVAGTGYRLVVTGGGLDEATSAAFTVSPGPVHRFVIEAAGGGAIATQTAGEPFAVRIAAEDAAGNLVTSFEETVQISSSGTLAQGGGETAAFVDGVLASHEVGFEEPGTFTITATRGATAGTSGDIVVEAAPVSLAANDDDWSADASKHVLGNVRFSSGNAAVPFGITDNDDLPPGATIAFVGWIANGSATEGTTESGGDIAVTPGGPGIGRFVYDPPAGHDEPDRFHYIVESGDIRDTATVTLTVSGMIWFISNSAAECTSAASGCGRLSSPYSSLAAFDAENLGGVVSRQEENDAVFIFQSATPYQSGVLLRAGQRLIGQDATSSITDITGLAPASGSDPLPSMLPDDAERVVLGAADGVRVVSDNTVRGVHIRTSTGTALAGSSFGTLTLGGDLSIDADDMAINLQSGVIDGSFGHVSGRSQTKPVAVTLHNTATNGVVTVGRPGDLIRGIGISSGTGDFLIPATIMRSAGQAEAVALYLGRQGDVTFSGPITRDGGPTRIWITQNGPGNVVFSGSTKQVDHIRLTDNDPATNIAFVNGGLDIVGGQDTAAFFANAGGTVSVTGPGNVIAASGAPGAVWMANTGIGAGGITLRSATAASTGHGIYLANVRPGSGAFTVTGDGASDRTNETRGRVTARAAGDASGAGPIAPGSGGTLQGPIAVWLDGAGTVVLRNVVVRGDSSHAVRAVGATSLSLDNARLETIADAPVNVRSGAALDMWHSEVAGVSLVLTDASATRIEHSLLNTSGYAVWATDQGGLSLTIDNIGVDAASRCLQLDLVAQPGMQPAPSTMRVTRSSFDCTYANLITTSAPLDLAFEGNALSTRTAAHHDLMLRFFGSATSTIAIRDNVFRPTGTSNADAISFDGSSATAIVRTSISGNTVGSPSAPNSGGRAAVSFFGLPRYYALLEDNAFHEHIGNGVWVEPTGDMDLTVRSNVIRTSTTPTAQSTAVRFIAVGGSHCLDFRGNTELTAVDHGVLLGAFDIGTRPPPTIAIAGYTGAANTWQQIQTYFSSAAIATTATIAGISISATAQVAGTAGGCELP